MKPAARLTPQPWMIAPETRAVFDALARGGADARFVGGCVRDAWLNRPVKDVDIATHAPPERVMALLETAGVKAIPTGIQHGTVTAVVDRQHFEITTLRRDVESFGRHARVEFTDDWREDAARRDLTMNALSCTLDGWVYDPFGGLADMAAGRVRFVGAATARIGEDVLRLLRFFRFFAHYGTGEPDGEALAACRHWAPSLPTLSGERLQGETLRLLTAARAADVWRLMGDTGVMAHLLPAATRTGRLQRMIGLERALGHRPDALLRLAAVLDAGRTGALAAANTLRLSNAARSRLAAAVEPDAAVPVRGDGAGLRRALYRLRSAETFTDALMLAAAAGGPVSVPRLAAGLAVAGSMPVFPLSGRDLMAAGIERGPALGRTLRALESWWAGRDFAPDRAACLEALAQRLGRWRVIGSNGSA